MIMGTIYQIILKYMKIDDDDGSADFKEAMMLWLKNSTKKKREKRERDVNVCSFFFLLLGTSGYNGVKIENFGKSVIFFSNFLLYSFMLFVSFFFFLFLVP